jgi:peptidoglycan glycosyltransferase
LTHSGRRDLTVSLDIRLQLRVAAILQTRLREARSERGAIVVLDPDNGDLLASVSYPWPDDAMLAAADEESEQLEDVMVDRARYGRFPPGSTFKLVTAIAALNKSPALANETFECIRLGNGRVGNKVRGWGAPIQDDVTDRTPHGAVNLERGVVVSCNAYFAQLAVNRVKEDALLQTAQMFGIDVAKPNTPAKLHDALPQAAYGQGQVATSPLKMALVAATIANGGRGLPIRLSIAPLAPGEASRPRILNPGLARKLGDAMRQVVTQGTGRIISRAPIPIAGKTGTAEVENAKSHAWFIGYAPYGAASERIAFSVMIENAGYGATIAGPAAAEVVAAWDNLKAAR